MDSRFSEDYDPSVDIEFSRHDHDGFDAVLEAYQDRQKRKQQGSRRLRRAGFGEEFISSWESNNTKDEANLSWIKKGGTREWDRGKF
jgi:hypothetical protein